MNDDQKHTAIEGGYQPSTSESWLSRHAPYVLLLGYLYYCTQIAAEILREWFNPSEMLSSEMLPIIAIAIIVLFVAAFAGVAIRVVGQMIHGVSGAAIRRTMLGEPIWWRTWYPRALRARASVWDRLPPALKLMRTGIWLGLLLLPAGVLLVVFVLPTFQVVYETMGVRFPLMMRTYTSAVTIGGYVFPLIMLAAVVQSWRWRARHGLSLTVAFNALFSVDQDFWRSADARKLLTH